MNLSDVLKPHASLSIGLSSADHALFSPRTSLHSASSKGPKRSSSRVEVIRRRILVVDDEESIRVLLGRFLTRAGFDVDLAEDGAVAIEFLQKAHHDVVVSDLMMPNVDGFSLLAFIKREKPELLPRTIVVSAYSRLADSRLDPSCTLFEKPFDLTKMLAKINSFFHQQPPG